MSVPARAPDGVQTVEVAWANLFVLAEQYLGDATQWTRIADFNALDGIEPDFLIAGPVTLMTPPPTAAWPEPEISVEQLLFGRDP